MIKDSCEHEWERHAKIGVDRQPATYICKKCHHEMAAGVVFQLEEMQRQVNRHSEILVSQNIYNNKQLWWSRWLTIATWALVAVTLMLVIFT